MVNYKIELLAPAWDDLDAIADYHMEEVGPESARKITNKILSELERLKIFPLSCPLVPYQELAEQGYRMLVCGRYVCIYKLHGNNVYVYHIVASTINYPAMFK
ncbi:MAG: type II toxin-antitoxin system RelE/ParE family toxin [Defluviitaleaceae bacterium]|nr:type II toxin-antitoxin system RelE/ParE family toxin [Defluviitaleaceae bacterium]